ncbi:hypothetical protein F542_280 [Bibersteinia trehalosi USDA-ARS-USMARC-188]|uniref:Uncharacterized protein n=2 Tax=Bibersteinia trehalosi TaxID=47735 RepID=A0A4V7I6W0_BIBTR|nr:hypothetical protein WQG_22330 [Bibersteinia trehalosi USDA-ARS-USMARC-192]AHG80746.1 hypothetical protein F542_280 [Bibersteinia trehalosi USDA-ARS-USMARC-188]AHG82893.1 hypothetical protein F543_290 [Bibersteinia trehalosi USDA-ARS-USMARC-189]
MGEIKSTLVIFRSTNTSGKNLAKFYKTENQNGQSYSLH